MTEFSETWNLTRKRFLDEISGLNDEQLRWRLHPQALSIGEMALHVAGVEISFASQLLRTTLTAEELKLKSAATDGILNDLPCPYPADDVTAKLVSDCLNLSKSHVEPLITSPSEDAMKREIKSAMGPMITCNGALARLSYHPGYHQGQASLIKSCPGFPQ